jgi:hypothetical protein
MKFRLVYTWDIFRLVLMVYMYIQQLTLRDVNGLCLRAEDRRLKKFRSTFCTGPEERRVDDRMVEEHFSLKRIGYVLTNPGTAV